MTDDEAFARQLQSEEFRNRGAASSRPAPMSQQEISDEELARRLTAEEQMGAGSRFTLQTGQTAMVKLHHPLTTLQIGETLLLHFLAADEMVFELAQQRGKYLKAKNNGTVEFSSGRDLAAQFKVANSASGHLYLMPKNFLNQTNRANSVAWHLTMAPGGALSCNGGRDRSAEWQLVSDAALAGIPPTPATVLNNQHTTAQAEITSMTDSENPLLRQSAAAATNANGYNGAAIPMSSVVRNTSDSIEPDYPMATFAQPPSSSSVASPSLASNNNCMFQQQQQQVTQPFPGYNAGKEALMKYFLSSSGMQFLREAGNEAALDLHLRNGLLAQILHRPDWLVVARRFKEYPKLPVVYRKDIVDASLVFDGFKHFFEQGYTQVTNAVPQPIVQNALKIINYWHHRALTNASKGTIKGKFNSIECTGEITQDLDILAVYYESCLPHIMQRLMGADEIDAPKVARIITTYPCLDLTVEAPVLSGSQWSIDGFNGTEHGYSPYNVLVGVALTDISDLDYGNICAHSGSHLLLLDQYREHAERKQTMFSADPDRARKPDLGSPTQIILRAGGAFLCTQRLAWMMNLNTSYKPTTIVFFRLSHVDHAVLKAPALQSMWLEFPYASEYLESEQDGRSSTGAVGYNPDKLLQLRTPQNVGNINLVHDSMEDPVFLPAPQVSYNAPAVTDSLDDIWRCFDAIQPPAADSSSPAPAPLAAAPVAAPVLAQPISEQKQPSPEKPARPPLQSLPSALAGDADFFDLVEEERAEEES